jgi:two-component system NtrC family sensor kinase
MVTSRESTASPSGAVDVVQSADYALSHRPSFGIRKKIALSFFLCFVVTGAVTLTTHVILQRIEQRLHFLDLADIYTSHIQQARRYEKNFLLYGTDLSSAITHVAAARVTLSSESAHVEQVVGARTHRQMLHHLEQYERLLGRLGEIGPSQSDVKLTVESDLRQHGAQMVEVALRVADTERQRVRRLLRLSKQMPVVALVLLLVLIIYVVRFLTRQILFQLGRMMSHARRISEGDFSPIFPARRYRDEFTGVVIAMNRMTRELDRRQQMLAEAQKLRAVGTLTAGVAHELNNPLNNITLTAEALLEDFPTLPDDEKLDMCRDVLEQADRAQGIVRSLLDFSRQREPQMSTVSVAEIVARANRLLSNQLRLADIRLETDVAPDLPPTRGDQQQLEQVFVNLYLNALQAMDKGGRLRVSAALAAERRNSVRIDISDTGQGIPGDALPYIFDPFFSTKGAKGHGLGLSVSYGILAKHGGSIEVNSKLGEGTTFSIFLPVETGV